MMMRLRPSAESPIPKSHSWLHFAHITPEPLPDADPGVPSPGGPQTPPPDPDDVPPPEVDPPEKDPPAGDPPATPKPVRM